MTKRFVAARELVLQNEAVLRELQYVWPEASVRPLWWDRYRNVFATTNHRKTYRALWGRFPRRFARDGYQMLRGMPAGQPISRWIGPIWIDIPLPSSAVVLPVIKGLVIASDEVGCVLKLGFEGWKKRGIWDEVEALSLARRAGIEAHTPKLMSSGTTSMEYPWLLTQLVPNTRPMGLGPAWFWRRWLQESILPTLEQFYDASEIVTEDVDEVLEREGKLLQQSDAPEALWNIFALAREARPSGGAPSIVVATIHGDLFPRHVHRHKGDWWLIDWGGLRKEVFFELFRRYLQAKVDRYPHIQPFWAWLRGTATMHQIPRSTRAHIELFLYWQKSWWGVHMEPAHLRYQVLAAILRGARRRYAKSEYGDIVEASTNPDKRDGWPMEVRQLALLHAFD